MERLFVPSFQSKTPLLYIYPSFSIQSNRKTIFIGKPNDIFWNDNFLKVVKFQRLLALQTSSYESGSTTQRGLENLPLSVQLQPISDESQFDRVIADAQQVEESVVILWMASWCRKCIYLKPKLEKLAADYYPRIRFYSIDVNNVPHKLVVRAGVTKMPTIQLWRDGQKQSEVIGGTKAHLIINDVRQMIEDEDNM